MASSLISINLDCSLWGKGSDSKKRLTNTIRQKTYKKKVRVQKRPLKGWLTTKKGWLTQNNTKKNIIQKPCSNTMNYVKKSWLTQKKGWPETSS